MPLSTSWALNPLGFDIMCGFLDQKALTLMKDLLSCMFRKNYNIYGIFFQK